VFDETGNKVIRSLTDEEVEWLDKFYKEYVHSTFVTDSESTSLFKKAKRLSKKTENVKHLEQTGEYPKEVTEAVNNFNDKSKKLGNLFCDFWQQRDINSDDYKRKHDIQNNSSKGLQLESFEDVQYVSDFEENCDTQIEDLITESED